MFSEKALKSVENAIATEADCISKLREFVDSEQFSAAVELLKGAERIGASGCGHSGILCQHIAHLLCCIERPARFISPAEAVHGASGFLKENDVMILVSRGGKTSELMPVINICRAKNVKIITMTEKTDSPMAKESDVVLKMFITRETDKWNTQGTTSFTVGAVLAHALQAALIEETDYQAEQFGLIHPGGAVGERLNGKGL